MDVERFIPQLQKLEPGNILYFGTLIRKKGVLELPEIFNRLVKEMPQARFLFAGRDVIDIKTGRSTKELMLEKFSPAAANKLVWLDNQPYEKILEQIAKAHVVVLPSFAEALPMTWIEAMAMEKAMVTSDIGWAKEVMIDGATGFTVDPKDHELYAERILQLLNDTKLAEKMGKAARERVIEKFSTEVVVDRNIEYFRKVVSNQY